MGLKRSQDRAILPGMKEDNHIIDMTLQGEFVSSPPPPRRLPLATRIFAWAVLAAVIGGAFTIAALALWFVMMILPFVLGAAAVAYIAYRYQVWRGGHTMMGRGPGPPWRGPGR